MKYFKLIRGFDAENYIEIDETELEKAEYCFLTKKDAIYSGGAVRGQDIQMIQPDYHRAMGWNRGYKLMVDDFDELRQRGIDRKHMDFLAENKMKIKHLMDTKQEHLIGRNIEIPELKRKELPPDLQNELNGLANKFKI